MQERLQKVLAQALGISRRKAEVLIAEGRVCVEDKVAVLGQRVDPINEKLLLDGKPVGIGAQKEAEVWMVYKPRGIVCTNVSYGSEKNLWQVLPKKFSNISKWIFVGRLDKESEGLLLITTDGGLANRIMHPSFGILKKYQVTLDQVVDKNLFPLLQKGIRDDGEHLYFAEVRHLKNRIIEATLAQGKKREIRRLLQHFQLKVLKLKRVQIGNLHLPKEFMAGDFKRLSLAEINLIFE